MKWERGGKGDSLIRVICFFWSTETAVLNLDLARAEFFSQTILFSSRKIAQVTVSLFANYKITQLRVSSP